jgi:hypothetical protein
LEPGTVVGISPESQVVKTGPGTIKLMEIETLTGIKLGEYL